MGLTRAECCALALAARHLPGCGWFTRQHADRGRTIALVLPSDEWDQRLPLFLVWRGAQGPLHLCMGRGSDATDLGRFASIRDAAASIEREVRHCLSIQMEDAATALR